MGLAPYGEPKYAKLILDNLIDLKPDGSFRLDMSYFDYCTGLTMTNERFAELFGEPVRAPDKLLTDSPGTSWAHQLTAVVTALRTGQTQYDIKKNQAELAEKNVAQLLEQLRQAQQQTMLLTGQNAELRQEVEKLKNGKAESPKN